MRVTTAEAKKLTTAEPTRQYFRNLQIYVYKPQQAENKKYKPPQLAQVTGF